MSACLTPDEFVDLADGSLSAERRAHLGGCATCRATAAEVAEALHLAAAADVPEPPALFWPSINARVRAAIADDAGARGWRAWFRVDVLLPFAGLALVVMALASAIDAVAPGGGFAVGPGAAELAPGLLGVPTQDTADAPAAPNDDAEDALAMMVDLADSLPDGGWDSLGVTRLPDLDVAVSALNADEQAALAELLHQAVERPKS